MLTTITACSGSDNDDNLGDLSEELFQYAWQSNTQYSYMEWGDNASLSKDIVTLFFLPGNTGIGKYSSLEWDTYFGKTKSAKPYPFSYSKSSSSVAIDDMVYQYRNGTLIAPDGTVFSKITISSSDREWLESAKYYVMDDEERYNFNFEHACIPVSQGGNLGSGTYYYDFNLLVGVKESEHVFSRQISFIEVTYTISGGTFRTSNPKTKLFIYADEDCSNSTYVVVNTKSVATITANVRIYDSKKSKYVNCCTYKYTVGEQH